MNIQITLQNKKVDSIFFLKNLASCQFEPFQKQPQSILNKIAARVISQQLFIKKFASGFIFLTVSAYFGEFCFHCSLLV